MKGSFLTKIASLALLTHYTFAMPIGEPNLYFGGANVQQGKEQFSGIFDTLGNIHTIVQKNSLSFLIGGGYFVNMRSLQNLDIDVGGQVYYIPDAQFTGIINQELTFPNLSYQYKTDNLPFYAAARLKWNTSDKKRAFVVDGGVGPNIVLTKDYYEQSLDGITIPNQAYSGKSKTVFTAAVGAGIKFNNIWHSTSFEVGYKYFYLNKGTLKPRNGVLNTLTTGTVDANALVLTLVA